MDNAQNTNARFVDNFGNGKTSVKTSNPPGGKSSFSLGWDDTATDYNKYTSTKKNFNDIKQQSVSDNNYNNNYQPQPQQQGRKFNSQQQQNQQNFNNYNYGNGNGNQQQQQYQQPQVISNPNPPKTSVRVRNFFLLNFFIKFF